MESEGHGLVMLPSQRLIELMSDQNTDSYDLTTVLESLKSWHPLISDIEFDLEHPHRVDDLTEYNLSRSQFKLIQNDEQFELFKRQSHLIIDIKVHFKLLKRFDKIEDFNVNFHYLHKLLDQSLEHWKQTHSLYLDEVSVTPQQLPFMQLIDKAKLMGEEMSSIDVYPYVHFIPLYSST